MFNKFCILRLVLKLFEHTLYKKENDLQYAVLKLKEHEKINKFLPLENRKTRKYSKICEERNCV